MKQKLAAAFPDMDAGYWDFIASVVRARGRPISYHMGQGDQIPGHPDAKDYRNYQHYIPTPTGGGTFVPQ